MRRDGTRRSAVPGLHAPGPAGPVPTDAEVIVPTDTQVIVPTDAGVIGPGGPAAPSLVRRARLVAPALVVVNVVGYVLAVAASRALDPAGYGELGALLGVSLVACVPAVGLQAVVAREVAGTRVADRADRERALLRQGLRIGLLSGALALALAPAVAAFLRVGLAGPVWVAVALVPLAVLTAVQGLLQGEERFAALAAVLVAQAAGKAVGLAPLLVGGGAAGVLAGLALGTVLAAGVAVLVLRRAPGAPTAPPSYGPRRALPGLRATVLASGGLLALLVLSNVDLLIARNQLPDAESGLYAVGNVLSKSAFWLPQAVAVVAFPRLVDPGAGDRVLRAAVAVVAGLGLTTVAGAALLGRPAVELAFGTEYAAVAGPAPLFVLQGTALALVQLLVYRGIATHDRTATRAVALTAAALAAALLILPDLTVLRAIGVATSTAVLLAAALLVPALRGPAGQPLRGPVGRPVRGSAPAPSARP